MELHVKNPCSCDVMIDIEYNCHRIAEELMYLSDRIEESLSKKRQEFGEQRADWYCFNSPMLTEYARDEERAAIYRKCACLVRTHISLPA